MVSTLTLILTVPLVTVALWLYWRRWRYWRSHFKRTDFLMPGFALPLIGHVYLLFGSRRGIMPRILDLMKFLRVNTKVQSLLVWFGESPYVFVLRAEDVEAFLGSSKPISKPYVLYKTVRTFFGDGLIALNGNAWLHHRKVLTPVFHFKILERYVDVFKRRAEELVKNLCGPEFQEVEVDALPIMTKLVSNTICETAFGMSERLAEADEIKKKEAFLDALETGFKIIEKRITKPWFILDSMFRLSPLHGKFQKAEATIYEYTSRIIKMKKEEIAVDSKEDFIIPLEDDIGAKKKVAFLDLVLRDAKNLLTEDEVFQEVRTLVTVQQTTASTLSFIFVMLAIHQDIQEEVYREMKELDDLDDFRTYYERLGEMKYLERVIKETLRLYPVTPAFGRRVDEDIVLPSGTIPAGCGAAFFVYWTHRDKRFFGPDPERFDPDHFLPERCQRRHPYAFVPFSAGPRNCIGQKYAMLQMKAVVSTVVRSMRIFPGKGCHSQEELHLDIDTFLHIAGGFNVRFERRAV